MNQLILVVDDDDFIRDVLREMLSQYQLLEAESGGQAVQLFREKRPRLVLMDIMMPEMDGIEATRAIKSIDSKAVILGISAFANVKGEQMLKAGANEILSKPVKMQELRLKVKKYMDAGE